MILKIIIILGSLLVTLIYSSYYCSRSSDFARFIYKISPKMYREGYALINSCALPFAVFCIGFSIYSIQQGWWEVDEELAI